MTRYLSLLALAAPLIAADPQTPAPYTPIPRIEVILFSDFQCPFCGRFAQAFRQLQSQGIEGVPTAVRFKNFPLSFHPFAQLAHQAAAAAGEQGKFWEMHDLLFANQQALQREDLLRYASQIGLNMDRFRKDLESERVKQAIEADKKEGEKIGVSGTPTFFVDGKSYTGARSYDELKNLIAREQLRLRALSEITADRMSRGPAHAPVTVEFFADLESPVSRSASYVLDELTTKYPEAVRLQFRNYPLSFHPQAPLAHEAAMAAARQGHFWEVANYVFDHQESLREPDLIAFAGVLGLDPEKFAEAIRTHSYAARVDADLQDGFKRGVRGSPVIFVNGKRIDGVPSLGMLREVVEAELSAKQGSH